MLSTKLKQISTVKICLPLILQMLTSNRNYAKFDNRK